MKTLSKILGILFLFLVLAWGKGNTTSAGAVYASIGLRTRAAKNAETYNNVTATATFRKKNKRGKRLILQEPAKIEINGNEMIGRKDFIGRWHYSLPVLQWKEQFEIRYTDAAGEEYLQTLRLDRVQLVAVDEPISLQEDWVIAYEGEPLRAGEYFQLWIEQSGELPKTIKVKEAADGHLRLSQKYLKKYKKGPAKITLDRIIVLPMPGVQKGSVLTGRFESQRLEVIFL